MTPLHLVIPGVFEGRVEALLHNGYDVKIYNEFGKNNVGEIVGDE